MTRRALSPAARGVLLAVSAALRSRVVVISDAPDGTTTATVTEPDGTVLLRCAVRAVSTRRDSRQLGLPLAPGAQHEAPAPVAVVPSRVRKGDVVELDGVAGMVVALSDADGVLVRRPGGDVVVLESDLTRIGEWEWRASRRAPPPDDGPAEVQRAEAPAPQDDDGPAPINGVCVGDKIRLDDEPVEVMGVDHEGFAWRTVATVRGRSVDEGECLWSEVEDLGRGAWRVLPVDTEAPAKREKAPKPDRLETTQEVRKAPVRAAAKPKPKPARLTRVPAADAVAQSYHGAIVIAWQQTDGAAWERVWSEPNPTAAQIDAAWRAACEGHCARQYNRGGRCVRDSADGAEVSRG